MLSIGAFTGPHQYLLWLGSFVGVLTYPKHARIRGVNQERRPGPLSQQPALGPSKSRAVLGLKFEARGTAHNGYPFFFFFLTGCNDHKLGCDIFTSSSSHKIASSGCFRSFLYFEKQYTYIYISHFLHSCYSLSIFIISLDFFKQSSLLSFTFQI